jgi:hypothetical protein
MRAFREAEQCLRCHVRLSRTAELVFTTSMRELSALNRYRARNSGFHKRIAETAYSKHAGHAIKR